MKNLFNILVLGLFALLPIVVNAQGVTFTKVIDPRQIPPATASQRGGVRIGSGLKALEAGVISLDQMVNAQHLDGATAMPTVASASGSGTGAVVSLIANSNDIAGRVSITAGTSPVSAGVIARITFAIPYTTAPFVTVQGNNLAAANLPLSPYPTNVTTTGFDIALPTSVVLIATTGYLVGYKVIQ